MDQPYMVSMWAVYITRPLPTLADSITQNNASNQQIGIFASQQSYFRIVCRLTKAHSCLNLADRLVLVITLCSD